MKFPKWFRRTAEKQIRKRRKRNLEAGQTSRTVYDWLLDAVAPDTAIRQNLKTIRDRSRDLVTNEGYATRFISMVKTNVVGHKGFAMQMKARDPNGKLDTTANRIIEGKWKEWQRKKNCDVSGRMSFREMQRFLAGALAKDGEFFVRKIRSKNSKFGFQLQLIEPDLVDEQYASGLPGDKFIANGVEMDKFRKPLGYYLKEVDQKTQQYGDFSSTFQTRKRIPATEMYHVFLQERAWQSRGLPWMLSATIRLKMLKEWQDASVINARVGAAKMGFFTTKEGASEYTGEGQNAEGETIMDVTPGQFERLPDGLDFTPFEPTFPTDQYDAFTKSVLRGISSALGVSYNVLANDLEGVNYSSIRAGLVEEREVWKGIQEFMIEAFLEDVFEDWLKEAILTNQVPLPIGKIEKFNSPLFIGRRWTWVDPKSDVVATVMAIENGLQTKSDALAEQGKDFEDVVETTAEEDDIMEAAGVEFGPTVAPPQQTEETDDEEE